MKWHYPDTTGTWHEGTVEHITDLGGTDITYRMRNDDDGHVAIVSGSRLRSAHAVYGPVDDCPVCAIRADDARQANRRAIAAEHQRRAELADQRLRDLYPQ